MGSSCCKNALDKVRPPPRPRSFVSGEPPDLAAPWPGDTFRRAPAAQAFPVFPEGAFDSPLFPRGSLSSTTSTQHPQAETAAVMQPPTACFRRRRSSVRVANSGAPFTEQQRHSNLSPSARVEPAGIDPNAACHFFVDDSSSKEHAGADIAALNGTPRQLPTRLRQALRASSRRIASRLRSGIGSGVGIGDDAAAETRRGRRCPEEGTAAPAVATGAVTFPDHTVDDTHFVSYPPASLSSTSATVNAGRAVASPAGPPSQTRHSFGAAAGGGRSWRLGGVYPSSAATGDVSVSSPAGGDRAPHGRAAENEACDALQREGDRRVEKTQLGGGAVVDVNVVTTTKKTRNSCSSKGSDQRGIPEKGKSSRAARSLCAAVEGAWPRWRRGSRGPAAAKKERQSQRTEANSNVAEDTEGQKFKRSQSSVPATDQEKRGVSRDIKKTGERTVSESRGRSALRSSHCSSASTAAHEEDEFTTTGMENWWSASLPSYVETEGQELSQRRDTPSSAAALLQTNSFFDAAADVDQQQQHLGLRCASLLVVVPPAGAATDLRGESAAIDGAAAAPATEFFPGTSAETQLKRSSHYAKNMTAGAFPDPFYTLSPDNGSAGDTRAGCNTRAREKEEADWEQQVTANSRIEPHVSSLHGQENRANPVANVCGSGVRSSTRYTSNRTNRYSNSSNSNGDVSMGARSEGDASLSTAATANGGSRPGEECIREENFRIAADTNTFVTAQAALAERELQPQGSVEQRQLEVQSNAENTSHGTTNNQAARVVSMPFPE